MRFGSHMGISPGDADVVVVIVAVIELAHRLLSGQPVPGFTSRSGEDRIIVLVQLLLCLLAERKQLGQKGRVTDEFFRLGMCLH